MKVGVYCPDFNPTSGGGYTYQVELLCALSELADESKHKFVIFTQYPDNIQKYIPSNQIQIVKISKYSFLPSGFLNGLQYLVRSFLNILFNSILQSDNYRHANYFEKIAKSHNIDFVWFPSPFSSIPVNIPYLSTVWDLEHRVHPYFPEVEVGGNWESREAFYSRYLPRASIVVVGTETGRKEVERFYQVPYERIKVLPLPTPRFSVTHFSKNGQEILKKYAIPQNYLFYPAQFWSHKNHVNLLIALKILKQEHNISIPLVLVGSDKGNENYIRKLTSKWELSSQVHILGFVPQEDIIALYQNALALTFMTFFGPDNLPPLEAFALGCPVIASNVAGAEEQLGDAALLVDPKSPEQIADAIFNVYNSQNLRNTLIERGLKRAQQWTGQDFVRGIFSILDELETVRRCWE
jgi:glycosyltransferase involved in cell wall biosynthesis